MSVNAVKFLCNNLYLNNKCIHLNVQRIGPLQEIWLTGNLTNHNAESAIFVRQTRSKPQQGKPATFCQKKHNGEHLRFGSMWERRPEAVLFEWMSVEDKLHYDE